MKLNQFIKKKQESPIKNTSVAVRLAKYNKALTRQENY